MFGFNLFSAERFVESTTILWLRILSLIVTAVGGYLLYLGRQSTPPSTPMTVTGSIFLVIGIGSLLAYLLYGDTLANYVSGGCSYCPITPTRVRMNSGTVGSLPEVAPLPSKDPFRHTAVYYVLIDWTTPSSIQEAPSDIGRSIIYRPGLYHIILDGNTGGLGVIPDPPSPEEKTRFFGNLPLQSLTQVAMIHNEKEIRVFVNGVPRGAMVRQTLPPTSSVRSSFVFNQGDVVNTGMIYQVEIHEGELSSETLMNEYERTSIQYENEATFQNTRIPTDITRSQMSFTDVFVGYIRLLSTMFGYQRGIEVASRNTTLVKDTSLAPTDS